MANELKSNMMRHENFEYGKIYHVYNRGNRSNNIFIEDRNYDLFFKLMKKYLLPVADIYAYCLMKNHFHLLIRIKEEENIAEKSVRDKPYLGFSHLFNAYTKSVNKSLNLTGSLFQEHLKRIVVTDEDYLIQLVAYIHLNPIKHGFADKLDYLYSSYGSILSDKPTLLKREDVLYYYGDKENYVYWHDFQKIKREEIIAYMNEDY
jgi:REP element-mobilizing transposase RayT